VSSEGLWALKIGDASYRAQHEGSDHDPSNKEKATTNNCWGGFERRVTSR